jgi:predicted nucleic acid-binding Zn ribbon protein
MNRNRSAAVRLALPTKGSCWYCERPVDNVRQFCSAACRDQYYEEEDEKRDGEGNETGDSG